MELGLGDAERRTATTELNRRQATLLDPAIDAGSGDVQLFSSLGDP